MDLPVDCTYNQVSPSFFYISFSFVFDNVSRRAFSYRYPVDDPKDWAKRHGPALAVSLAMLKAACVLAKVSPGKGESWQR